MMEISTDGTSFSRGTEIISQPTHEKLVYMWRFYGMFWAVVHDQ